MDYGKLRGSYRNRAEPDPVDLGDDPPLSVDGASATHLDRRRVSLRWYSGTILSGLCGAALMGGAVYVALDGEAIFAASPERAELARGALAATDRSGAVRKADRLAGASSEPALSARQVMRVSTTVQVGEREIVRVRPFVRVTANLSLSLSELSAGIGPLNQARVLASASGPSAPAEEAPNADDAEVSFVTRDLGPLLSRARLNITVAAEEVMARVREAANWGVGASGSMLATAPSGGRTSYAPESGGVDPYEGIDARIVPENITLLPKTAAQVTGGNHWNERVVTAKRGDSVSLILRELGATQDEAKAISAALGGRSRDGALKEGQKVRVLLTPTAGASQRLQPIRIIVMGESAPEVVVALSDTGRYVSVDVQSADTQQAAETDDDEQDAPGTVRLYQSIYETALRNQVPKPLIEEIIRIYSYDVDFQRKVQPGDSFEILHTGDDDQAGDGKSEVLYASLTVGGETKRYYRFVTADDGEVDYYDEHGKSAKKFLVRKPLDGGVMRSRYGWRRHPILGYSKMHTGVDWAAPRGTPIVASGNGTVERVGWEGGYGKYVRIRHAYGYETAYGHMSAYARGIAPGVRVRQGQVIGYVGSTGLSTGPHVHYEVLVNGRFVDPARIKLPRGRSLDGPLLANFEQERDKVDGMMTRSQLSEAPPPARGPRREARHR